jgi:putative FmdB family regulatory protein
MPIFEYTCQDCGNRFEKLVRRASESGDVACPSCGEKHVQQELSVFAAHANGSPKSDVPMCPGGGPCRTPGACGLN